MGLEVTVSKRLGISLQFRPVARLAEVKNPAAA
jgi:hypothetical protein